MSRGRDREEQEQQLLGIDQRPAMKEYLLYELDHDVCQGCQRATEYELMEHDVIGDEAVGTVAICMDCGFETVLHR